MKSAAASLAATALLIAVSCSSPSNPADGPLPVLSDYPGSINATGAQGTLQLQANGCLVFTRADGREMLPIFRPGSTMDALQARFGDLAVPSPVSIMGMTVLETVPSDAARFVALHKCDQTPFVFGSFGEIEVLPPAPPADGLQK